MDQNLRQRGWSIHSSDDHHTDASLSSHQHQQQQQQQQQRPRADSHMTCDTEPSMSEAEKLHLLNSAFEEGVVADHDEHHDGSEINTAARSNGSNADENASDDDNGGEGGGGDDFLDMFGGEDDDDDDDNSSEGGSTKEGPPKKRRKTGDDEAVAAGSDDDSSDGSSSSSDDDNNDEDNQSETAGGDGGNGEKRPHIKLTQKQQDQLDLAKNKLSKWAARLFDPNRPRGLVEPPKVIPLNDEFLTAFGKREKEYDDLAGREIEIDKTSLDIIDDSDNDGDDEDDLGKPMKSKKAKESARKRNFAEMSKAKVKIANLAYATTTATIARACGIIGPVVDVNLILDDDGRSSGRAYVVFEDHETAEDCVERLNEKTLEGRTLRISLASKSGSTSRKSSGGGDSSKKLSESRYWERDISTKCNYCGEVGHIAKNCPNEQQLKPCGLCGGRDGHDMWSCPQKSICFNCGVPGHVSRECNQRRGMPPRKVCTICYQSGHHRTNCNMDPQYAPIQDAVCMQCGQVGHLMCSKMNWFFGRLRGVSCFNCGQKDHDGYDCGRPDVNVCHKNPEIAMREINMAGAMSLSDQLASQRSSRESRDSRMRQHHSGDNSRPRSMPPPRSRGGGNNDDYARGGPSNNSRDYNSGGGQRSYRHY